MKKTILRKAAAVMAAAYFVAETGFPSPVSAADRTAVKNLTVNYMSEPIGIDPEGLCFGWQLSSDIIGEAQTAYEITVTKDGSTVWCSGLTENDISVGIPYEGPELEEAVRYEWNVRVETKNNGTVYGEGSSFELGVSNDEDWNRAEFICMPSSSAAPIFRTEKELSGELASARLYITAIGVYDAQINGRQVYKTENGERVYHHMNPGYGNGAQSLTYETYDVTELIGGQSAAVVTVTAGLGWSDENGNSVMGSTSGRPAIKAMLTINYTDGSRENIITNTDNWRGTLDGPITANGVYYGEDYDARKAEALGKYWEYGYDDSSWYGVNATEEKPYIIANDIDVSARYLRLSVSEVGPATANDGESRLQIMELEAIDKDGNNAAYGIMPTVSDDFNYGAQWRAANLTDGDTGTESDSGYTSGILSKTYAQAFRPDSPLTLELDLGSEVSLRSVRLYCRTKLASVLSGICPNYPKEYSIQVSSDGESWTDVITDYQAGSIRAGALALDTLSYAGEIKAASGMSGRIVDEFEQRPVSAVIYSGTKADSEYPGGEIDIDEEYYGEDIFGSGITLKKGQTMVVNMGQNLTAIPEIKFIAAEGAAVEMKFAEMLNDGSAVGSDNFTASGPKGSIYTKSLRAARSAAVYIFAGSGEEIYQPKTSFFGYQYIQLTADSDVTITGIRSRALSSVSRQTGNIKTNNENVNRLFLNALYGQLSNYFTMPTDCPQRDERLAWTGDAQAFAKTAMYNFDSAAFLNSYQDIISDRTLLKGYPSAVVSLSGYFDHWSTGWSDVEVINAYAWYTQTGDKEFLKRNWDALTAYMTFLKNNERAPYQAPDARFEGKWVYGDWLAFQGTGAALISDCYYGYVTSLMAIMAEEIGETEAADYYADYFEKQKETFISNYVIYSKASDYPNAQAFSVPTQASPGVSNVISCGLGSVSARYIRFIVDHTGPGTKSDGEYRLQMMEVSVYGESGLNVALGKSADSDNDFSAYGWKIGNLTDGSLSTGYSSNNNGTSVLASPITVTIDLEDSYEISTADIYCRTGEVSMQSGVCPNYPKHFTVEVSDDGEVWTEAGEYIAENGGESSLTVKSSQGGTYGYFDANKAGSVEDNSQTSLLWMLKLGWYDGSDMRDAAIDLLIENIRNENPDASSVRADMDINSLSVGFLGSNVIAPVLTDIGRADVSYDLLLNDSMPSWLFEVKAGATTVWERWNSYSPEDGFGNAEMNSFNHFAYGSIAEWMYRYMAGISSDNGFKNIILQPVTDTGKQYNGEERIRSVSGEYDSYYGKIKSSWEADETGSLTYYQAVIPANTSAVLYLPASFEQIAGFQNIAGVTYLGMTVHNGIAAAELRLESGGYDFTLENGVITASVADGYAASDSAMLWQNLSPESFLLENITQGSGSIALTYHASADVCAIVAEYDENGLADIKTYELKSVNRYAEIPIKDGDRLFIWDMSSITPLVKIY